MHDDGNAAAVLAPARGRVLSADPHAFAGLYVRHRATVTAHARRYLRDPRDADEVVQEAFLRLFLTMPELESELQALAYCRRTITNLCIDRYRADARRPRLVALEHSPVDELAERDTGDPVVRAEDAELVRAALAQLPELHRAALIMREIEEKPLQVIADELDVAEDSVKHLLFRARRGLRKLLAGTSVAPGADAELTRGLRPLARSTSGGAAALLLLALLGLGSGPDLRAVPVVGVDLPDVLGVTVVADHVGEAVREVVRAVVPDTAHADAAAPARSDAAVQPGRERPAAAGAAEPAGTTAVPSRLLSAAQPPELGGAVTGTGPAVPDGRPVTSVRLALPGAGPAAGGAAAAPTTTTGRGADSAAQAPTLFDLPGIVRDLPAPGTVRAPLPGDDAPGLSSAPDAPVRPPRVDQAVPDLPRPAVERPQPVEPAVAEAQEDATKAAERSQRAVDRAVEKADEAAHKAAEKADEAAEKADEAAEKAAEKADEAAKKVEKAGEKAAEKAAEAAERAAALAARAAELAAARAAAELAAAAAVQAAAAPVAVASE